MKQNDCASGSDVESEMEGASCLSSLGHPLEAHSDLEAQLGPFASSDGEGGGNGFCE